MRRPQWHKEEHMRLLLTVCACGLAFVGLGAEFLDPAWRGTAHMGNAVFTLVWIWEL